MSTRAMKLLVHMQNVWDNPLQGGIMAHLAWWESETADYALASYGYFARHFDVERRYVMRVMEQLELEKLAVVNLGPDPAEGGHGRNRWKLTLELAIAKVRRDAGVGDEFPLHRIERRRQRRRTVVIPGSPEETANVGDDGVGEEEQLESGDPRCTPLVIPGSPPGAPGIDPLVIPGSPQSGPVRTGTSVIGESTAADAAAPAASSNLEFTLIGEALGRRHDRTAKQASETRRSKLYHRVVRHARWCLEHRAEAAALIKGEPIATLSALVAATEARCGRLRIPGYGEGDVLDKACRSEWHLFEARRKVFDNSGEIERLRDHRTNPYETTRGTRRRR